jgi:hypothetical protein
MVNMTTSQKTINTFLSLRESDHKFQKTIFNPDVSVKNTKLWKRQIINTYFEGFDKKYMISQGAVYYELSHVLAVLYILLFALRKYKRYKENMSMVSAVHYMLCGVRQCKMLK